jgi:multicomponent Na+:H+ antiporter subunit C
VNETLALVGTGGALLAAGTVLLLSRPLTRIVLGIVVLGNGVNLLLLATSGPASRAPLLAPGAQPRNLGDPLPQAFILTAIVITLAMTSFLSAMAYRAWQLSGTDDVQDDIEDRRVAHRAEHGEEHGPEPAAEAGPAPPRAFQRRARRRELIGTKEEKRTLRRRPPRPEARYHEARRRARAETLAHHGRAARPDEETPDDDLWETVLGADR